MRTIGRHRLEAVARDAAGVPLRLPRLRRAVRPPWFAWLPRLTLLTLTGLAAAPHTAAGQDLTVSAAISLKETLAEIAPAFEKANPGVAVRLNLGASGDLQRQIEAGAPVDVYVSAAARNMDVLERWGGVDPRTRRDIACNRLVVVVPADAEAPPASLEALAGAKNVALGNPKTVPAGEYARQALEAAGLWERLRPSFVFSENVRAALEYVARGDADAAFVYVTDAGVVGDRVRIAFEVDPRLYQPIVYPAAAVAGSRNRELARRFVDFLVAPAFQAALRKGGFSLPPCGRGGGRG